MKKTRFPHPKIRKDRKRILVGPCGGKLKYIIYRNLFNKVIRIAKQNYYSEKLNTPDIKTTWKYTNELLGRSNEKKTIPNVMYDAKNTKFEGPKKIANEFNRFLKLK